MLQQMASVAKSMSSVSKISQLIEQVQKIPEDETFVLLEEIKAQESIPDQQLVSNLLSQACYKSDKSSKNLRD